MAMNRRGMEKKMAEVRTAWRNRWVKRLLVTPIRYVHTITVVPHGPLKRHRHGVCFGTLRRGFGSSPLESAIMARGSKKKYTNKQKRQADHIEEGYKEQGVGEDEAERRAWATVNKTSGGGKKSGSGRGKKTKKASFKKGGRKGGKKGGKK